MNGAYGDMKKLRTMKIVKREADGDRPVNGTDEVMENFGTYVMSRIKSMKPTS